MTEQDRAGTVGRQGDLSETFVALADTLVDDYDIVDLLDRLVSAAVRLFDVTAGGLLLDDQRGSLALMASSDESSRLLEIFQLETNQGPCLDCVRTATPVTSDDLGVDSSRWPAFAPEAVAAGFRAVTAVPLRLRRETIGGLNLFSERPGALSPDDLRVAQALADVATIGILQQRSIHRTTVLAEQLQQALNSRIAIEQAKGVLAERHGIDMATAFERLRGHARNHNMRLGEVASAAVRGEINPGGLEQST
jgi:GAF domain-containing protein